jgi:adenine-specific DNA-methyltransferase
MARTGPSRRGRKAETYRHEEEALLRPDVGTQAQFRKKKPPKTYRFDSSLSPALDWDGGNWAREYGEWLISLIEEAAALPPPHRFDVPRTFADADRRVEIDGLADAVHELSRIGRPFLDWAGKAERLSFDVPTLPLFVHERLSTKAILETLKTHERDRQMEMQLFADPQLPLHQQLEAYEHRGGWVNRMILGDSLVVMNSLLEYEGLGGQVQMIYIDPPYGVKFGSNFQPFVRRRDVRDGDDDAMTREPEMVKAYRDTWELGLHSYLTYLHDRMLVVRDLLTPSGSVFVQIGDENVHYVRALLDDVFGSENFCAEINFTTTTGQTSELLANPMDYLLWYARDRSKVRFQRLFVRKPIGAEGGTIYTWVETRDGNRRPMTPQELSDLDLLPGGSKVFALGDVTSQRQGRPSGPGSAMHFPVEVDNRTFLPGGQRGWTTTDAGMLRLREKNRLMPRGNGLYYVRYHEDFPLLEVNAAWGDTGSSFLRDKAYVVQTNAKVIERCIHLTTEPGDLVLDPTCGSGTTAYVAEQWGRRWITIDTSRVPLALARQRLLTATFPYYELQDPGRGPSSGSSTSGGRTGRAKRSAGSSRT